MDRNANIEFAVSDHSGRERIFKTYSEAAGFAVSIAASGRDSAIDVLIYSEEAAHAWGGEAAVTEYLADPEASVSERIVIKAESVGRVA